MYKPFCGVLRTQWLLLQNQEHSVKQFEVFREVVELLWVSNLSYFSCGWTYVVEDDQRWCPSTLNVADGEEDAMVVDRRYQLLNEEA